eukprot:CAMPEP_0119563348 /NCGR_PEP_ID=MMETSP1352-20130426/23143_1 /TAXON_ID=265584 /ORGANISM="Stauroneis constricta, Strain CCMP1120" /LENGTH=322 /DNA_ID=CAMNT_0007611925 /DNA_START=29 /DNA_END=997 /DNA_ORIENTATION=+
MAGDQIRERDDGAREMDQSHHHGRMQQRQQQQHPRNPQEHEDDDDSHVVAMAADENGDDHHNHDHAGDYDNGNGNDGPRGMHAVDEGQQVQNGPINQLPAELESHPAIRALLEASKAARREHGAAAAAAAAAAHEAGMVPSITPTSSSASIATSMSTSMSMPTPAAATATAAASTAGPSRMAATNQGVSFLLTDPCQPGHPIIYASEAFLQLTKYPLERVLGRNCRFMQGPDTNPISVASIRNAVEFGTDCSIALLNYRYDGTTFWNHLMITPILTDPTTGSAKYFLGVQYEVSPERAKVQHVMAEASSVTSNNNGIMGNLG